MRCLSRVAALGITTVGVAVPTANADEIELRSGQVYIGEVVSESARNVVIDTMVYGIRTRVPLRRSNIIRHDRGPVPEGFFDVPEPETKPAAEPAPNQTADGRDPLTIDRRPSIIPKPTPELRYAMIPVRGGVGEEITADGLRAALAEAQRRRIPHVVFLVDSPGGYLYEAYDLLDTLAEFDEDLTYTVVVEPGGAISAASVFVAAAENLIMRPGSTVGAATAYSVDRTTGSAQVDAKLNSAWASRLAATAGARGMPAAAFRAMADQGVSLWANSETGEFADSARSGPGWTQIDDGRSILTLTASQVEAFGLGIVANEAADELDDVIGVEPWRSAGPRMSQLFERSGRARVRVQEALNDQLSRFREANDRLNQVEKAMRKFKVKSDPWVRDMQAAVAACNNGMRALETLAAIGDEAEELGAEHLIVPPDASAEAYNRMRDTRARLLEQR